MSLAAGRIVPIANLPLKFPPRGYNLQVHCTYKYNRAASLAGDFFPVQRLGFRKRSGSYLSQSASRIFARLRPVPHSVCRIDYR